MRNSSPGRTGIGQRKVFEAEADGAAGRPKFILRHKAHGHRRGVPAARYQLTENRPACRFFVEMKWLRIELLGEGDDLVFLDPHAATRLEDLSDSEILEVSFAHSAFRSWGK